MRKVLLFLLVIVVSSCDMILKDHDDPQFIQKKKGKDTVKISKNSISIEEKSDQLKKKGYETFHYKEGDTTYLMQKYFVVFLKEGENRTQDSISLATLQMKHLEHLERMSKEGYTSLTGPFASNNSFKGMVIYNTPTQQMADSLAHLDPMVKAGRLKVEIYPWWTSKGGKLQ